MTEYSLEEHRKLVRKRLSTVLEMQDQQTSQVFGRIMDLTPDGFMLLAKQEMIPNHRYDMVLNLPEAIKSHLSINLVSECRWCQPSNTAGYFGAGFFVVSVDAVKSEAWKTLVEEF